MTTNTITTATRCGADPTAADFVPAAHVECCWLPNDRENLAALEADPDADPAVVAGMRRTVARWERKATLNDGVAR